MNYETPDFAKYYDVKVPPNAHTVSLLAAQYADRVRNIEVIAKRDYKRFHFFDGNREWYMEVSPDGDVLVIVDADQVEPTRAALATEACSANPS